MEPFDVGTRHWSRELPSVLMENLQGLTPSPEDPEEIQLAKTLRLLLTIMPGARTSPGSLGAILGEGPSNVIKGPWKTKIEQQIQQQIPRLEKEFAERIAAKPLVDRPLRGQPQDVYQLMYPKVGPPTIKSFVGAEYPRYGGDVYVREPSKAGFHSYPRNLVSVGKVFATEEEARKALFRAGLEHQRLYPRTFPPVAPEISEFASPESARRSWRLLEQELK